MAAIGDVDLSLISAQQKLAVSLLNVDFTMLRIEPPLEYQTVGHRLSVNRKQEAEGGALHGVARKLGAVFEAGLPRIPNLLRAYGQRASEISINQRFNPQGSREHGAFSDHIGADGTSLWAAATSGNEAIAVHLLACMLARVWSGPQATSIMSEMVEARKTILRKRLEANLYSMSEITAAHITFTREQLSAWDASARAWLRTADEAFAGQQREFMRVVRQFSDELSSRSDLYSSVEHVWFRSMEVMENLLSGKPQSILDPEPLIGLAAWHLYPDLAILGDTPCDIYQHDSLFAPGGILTLGMATKVASLATGVTWSLPLSHLRFYGRPVTSTGILAGDSERVTFEELKFVVLGALTGHWFPQTGGIDMVAEFLVSITECLAPPETNLPEWLELLTSTAREYVTTKDRFRQDAARLYKLGHRRGAPFLSLDGVQLPEAFGLLDFEPFMMSFIDVEEAIALVRDQLPKLIQDSTLLENGFISYVPDYKLLDTGQSGIKNDASHRHPDHPDFVCNHIFSEEFATICVSKSSTGTAKTHQRRIASYHTESMTGIGSWGVRGMLSPLTSQVMRRKVLAELTHEVCGLYSRQIDDNRADPVDGVSLFATHTGQQGAIESLIAGSTTSAAKKRPCRHIKPPFEYEWTKILRTSDEDWINVVEAETFAMPQSLSPRHGIPLAVCYEARPARKLGPLVSKSTVPQEPPRDISLWGGWRFRPNTDSPATREQPERIATQSSSLITHLNGPACTSLRDIRDVTVSEHFVVDQGCPEKYYVAASEPSDKKEKTYQLLIGDNRRFGVWLPAEAELDKLQVQSDDLLAAIRQKPSYAKAALQRLDDIWKWQFRKCKESLDAFVHAAKVFDSFPEKTVSISIIKRPLCDALWSKSDNIMYRPLGTSFACLAMFESGTLNINPIELRDVMAMASGNSLFMAEYFFVDPLEDPGKHLIRRTIGSIGRPGTSFLIPARALDSLKPEDSSWRHVPYASFDGLSEDHFKSTTLHLTFTGDEQPLNIGQTGFRDKEVFLIETVVQAYDKRRWIADLDLTSPYNFNTYLMKQTSCDHTEEEQRTFEELQPITSIDSWDELLDLPQNLCIVRAKDNWLARQAITAFAIHGKKQTILAMKTLCWKCISETRYPASELLVIN